MSPYVVLGKESIVNHSCDVQQRVSEAEEGTLESAHCEGSCKKFKLGDRCDSSKLYLIMRAEVRFGASFVPPHYSVRSAPLV